jgi:hypothetical protein
LHRESSKGTALMSSDLDHKLALLERVARTWNQAGINYAVAHGLAGYPARTGRDLDVLVQSDQIDLALSLADGVFRDGRWRIAYPPAIWGKRLLATTSRGSRDMLEIHTLSALTWRNVTLANHPAPTGSIGPFKVDSWVSFAKRVVGPLLAGNLRRFSLRPEEFSATKDEIAAATERLPRLLGTTLARALVNSVCASDLTSAVSLIPRLRRSAMLRASRLHPVRSLRLASSSLWRKLRQPLCPCAPIVAIVGPDGVGKSTTLQTIQRSEGHVFLDILVRHWRPGVLPRLAELAGREIARPDTDGLFPPRRAPGRFQIFRLLYYYLDFLLGGLTKDRIDSSRQRLVLYDRCFLDMAVDPVRFGLASPSGTDLCWRWLPKPDRIILLSDDAGRIHARKPELTTAEIQRQLDDWRSRAKSGQVHVIVDAGSSRDEVTDRIWEVIADAFVKKNGGDAGRMERDDG